MYLVRVQVLLLLPLLSSSLTIPSLTTPSQFHHNITVPSLGYLRIHCYTQPLPPTKRLPAAKIRHCYSALQLLLVGDKAMAPMHFTEDQQRGFKVPFAWGHESCQIIINNITPNAEDTFPIVLIAHLAAEVMDPCILESPTNLGGDVKVGSHEQFEVIVAGTGLGEGDLGVAGGNRSDDNVATEKRALPYTAAASY